MVSPSLASKYEDDEEACFTRIKELWHDRVRGMDRIGFRGILGLDRSVGFVTWSVTVLGTKTSLRENEHARKDISIHPSVARGF